MTLSKSKLIHYTSSQNGSHSLNTSQSSNSANFQECADCGSSNVQWASLNHGVLICDECCLAHRSLGRCISLIKSLKKSYWPQSLMDTLYELVRSNSNQIWEASLNQSNESNPMRQLNLAFKGFKKPTHKDSYATKFNFIKTKYENLAFISRGKYSSIEELNQQLISTVKTNNYEATLRILSQGADANYRNQDDGNQCIHAAVLNNQLGQIEILCLYGADLTSLDKNGLTAYELAKANNLNQIAERLLELQFELTDEFSFYLTSKRPDHSKGQHFLLPENSDNSNQNISRIKLDELPDHLFDELSKDIFDELDRRQIEIIWKSSVSQNLVNEPIPFLVIKSCFTQTRNQLRQKLARFNAQEFSHLLIELITESQRRYNQTQIKHDESSEDEEDPLYDKVPSDEDYASVASESSSTVQVIKTELNKTAKISSSKPNNSTNKTYVNVSINNGTLLEKKHPEKRSQSESPLKVATNLISNLNNANINFNQYDQPKNLINSPPLSTSSSSLSRSPKYALSPSQPKFLPKEHKILNTKFEKLPINFIQQSSTSKDLSSVAASSLVANAESTLNSIINSLNQIDYSHLNSPSNSKSPNLKENNVKELRNENELMKAMIERLMEENAHLRAEKMLHSTISNTSPLISTTNYITQNVHNHYKNEELNLYSTINNNKKNNNQLKEFETIPINRLKDNYFIKLENNEIQRSNFNSESLIKKIPKKSLSIENTSGTLNKSIGEENKQNLLLNELREPSMKDQSPSPSKAKINPNSKILIKQDSLPARSASLQAKMPYGSPKIFKTQQQQQPFVNLQSPQNNQFSLNHQANFISKNQDTNSQTQFQLQNQIQKSEKKLDLRNFPSKDAVIKKMKKITKAVQELFKATKDGEFASLKTLCDKVCNSANEMISLFPSNLGSSEIDQNLLVLNENCKKLTELINKCHLKLEEFVNKEHASNTNSAEPSNSTPSSPNSSTMILNSNLEKHSNEDIQIKNAIVTNLVSYSYEIAHTVKRIVCIMGHSENTNL